MLRFMIGLIIGGAVSFFMFALLSANRITPEEALDRAKWRISRRKEENLRLHDPAALEDSYCIGLINEVFGEIIQE